MSFYFVLGLSDGSSIESGAGKVAFTPTGPVHADPESKDGELVEVALTKGYTRHIGFWESSSCVRAP